MHNECCQTTNTIGRNINSKQNNPPGFIALYWTNGHRSKSPNAAFSLAKLHQGKIQEISKAMLCTRGCWQTTAVVTIICVAYKSLSPLNCAFSSTNLHLQAVQNKIRAAPLSIQIQVEAARGRGSAGKCPCRFTACLFK